MNYSYNLYSNVPLATDPAKKSSSGGNNMIPVRVVDVILDDTHEEWDKLGRSEAVGAIKYRLLKKDIEESDSTVLPVAYPISSDLKKFPLKNEIVLLTSAPGYGLDTSNLNVKTYYNTIVNLWNHPNHAAFPGNTVKPNSM